MTKEWKEQRLKRIENASCAWCGKADNLQVHHTNETNRKRDELVKGITDQMAIAKMAKGEYDREYVPVNCDCVIFSCPFCKMPNLIELSPRSVKFMTRGCTHCKRRVATVQDKATRAIPFVPTAVKHVVTKKRDWWIKGEWKAFQEKYRDEIEAIIAKIEPSLVHAVDYMDHSKDTEVLCQGCHFAKGMGWRICACKRGYVKFRFSECKACHDEKAARQMTVDATWTFKSACDPAWDGSGEDKQITRILPPYEYKSELDQNFNECNIITTGHKLKITGFSDTWEGMVNHYNEELRKFGIGEISPRQIDDDIPESPLRFLIAKEKALGIPPHDLVFEYTYHVPLPAESTVKTRKDADVSKIPVNVKGVRVTHIKQESRIHPFNKVEIVYAVTVEGGTVTRRDGDGEIPAVNRLMLTENVMQTTPIAVGDVISFKGSFNMHKRGGPVVQFVRKISKD